MMAAKNGAEFREYRFLIVGKSGSGKSSTGNTILGQDLFPTGTGIAAVTKTCEVRKVSKRNFSVEIVDSPGLFDPEKGNKEISEEIVKTSAALHPGPHAVLYVLKLDRYTPEEFQTYERLKKMFDKDIVKFTIVLFTGGDQLNREKKTIRDILESAGQNFKKVLEECESRVIIFNNMDSKRNKESKVNELLEMSQKVTRANGGNPYRCTVQEKVGHKLEETVTMNVEEMIAKDPKLKEFFRQMEMKIREKQSLVESHHKKMELTLIKKRDLEEAGEATLLALSQNEERRKEEEERKRKEEEKKQQEEEAARKERERKEKEEMEKKQREDEIRLQRERLELEKKKLELERELKREQEAAEKERKRQVELERQRDAERERQHQLEMERVKRSVVTGGKTRWVRWVADIAGGIWNVAKDLYDRLK